MLGAKQNSALGAWLVDFTTQMRLAAICRAVALSMLIAPTQACLSSNGSDDNRNVHVQSFEEYRGNFDQVFSGLILSTVRADEPISSGVAPKSYQSSDRIFWIRSRILVTRVWKGNPGWLLDVWTPGGSSCDLPMIAGSFFVAFADFSDGRLVARNSDCGLGVPGSMISMRGSYTSIGIAIGAAGLVASVAMLVWIGLVFRRNWVSRRRLASLPFNLCFIAIAIPGVIAVYYSAFHSVIAAIANAFLLALWSKLLSKYSSLGPLWRNAIWLVVSAVFGSFVCAATFSLDPALAGSVMELLASSVYWSVIGVLVFFVLVLLNTMDWLFVGAMLKARKQQWPG